MKLSVLFLLLFLLLFLNVTFAQEFPLGKAEGKWGAVVTPDSAPFELRLGTRLQGIIDYKDEKNNSTGVEENFQDFFVRRSRLNVEVKYKENLSFYMDIRNDQVGAQDKGEGGFNIGDGFLEVKKLNGSDLLNLRFYRAKIDVSRSQTASSSRLVYLNRTYVADYAAHYVSHNRRASNIQLLGHWNKKIHYQFALGDGVFKDNFYDAKGNDADSIVRQNFMLGGKIRLSPFTGWEDDKVQETYYGEGKHFAFGVGVFNTSRIKFKSGANTQNVNRILTNIELSAHYAGWNFLAESFKFQGQMKDFVNEINVQGSSEGHQIQLEYTFQDLNFIAPFVRYESWDKFEQADGFDVNATVVGVNWYLKGEKIRVGAAFIQEDHAANVGNKKVDAFQLYSMMNY